MKNPIKSFISFFVAPASQFQNRADEYCKAAAGKFSDFIFNSSKRTDIIMLLFNAVAILSSHTAQIHGLEKSTRENKDFLIEQEEKERKIYLALTLVPPLIINYFLAKKLEKGEITTKRARDLLMGPIAEDTGAALSDVYSKVTHKETVLRTASDFIKFLKKQGEEHPDVQDTFEKISAAISNFTRREFPQVYRDIKRKLKAYNKFLKFHSTDRLQDSIYKVAKNWDEKERECVFSRTIETRDMLRNGSAIDELCGLNSGILITSSVLYSIAASNVIMPFLKNRWTNQEYERSLRESGETRESMRRKRRFEYTQDPLPETSGKVFKVFSTQYSSFPVDEKNSSDRNTFEKFSVYSDLAYRNSGIKI